MDNNPMKNISEKSQINNKKLPWYIQIEGSE